MTSYVLDDDNNPVPCETIEAWTWREEHPERICVGRLTLSEGIAVSTVFLTLDHAYTMEEHVPILFETMIFGGEHDQYQRRYCTWQEAEEGHRIAVELVQNENPPVNYEFEGDGPEITWQ